MREIILLFVICLLPTAFAAKTPELDISTVYLKFDPKKPEDCDRYKEFIQLLDLQKMAANSEGLVDPEKLSQLEKMVTDYERQICVEGAILENPPIVTFTLAEKPDSDLFDKIKFNANLYTSGDSLAESNLGHSVDFEYAFDPKKIFTFKSDTRYTFPDDEEGVVLFQDLYTGYDAIMSSHWAIFGFVHGQRVDEKGIRLGGFTAGGAIYNFRDNFGDQDKELSISFAMGPDYLLLEDRTNKVDMMGSWRMLFKEHINKEFYFALAIWYRHSLYHFYYSTEPSKEGVFMDYTDFELELEPSVTFNLFKTKDHAFSLTMSADLIYTSIVSEDAENFQAIWGGGGQFTFKRKALNK